MKIVDFLILCFMITCILSCRGKGHTSSDMSQIKDTINVLNSIPSPYVVRSDTIIYAKQRIDNFRVQYSLHTNDIIADTIHLSDTESKIFYNRSLLLTVHYNEELIVDDYEVKSTSFSGIENPERFQLAPMGAVNINSVSDTLFVSTGMFVIDTDWGYFLTIKIAKTGDIFLGAEDADDYYIEESD